MNVFLYLLAPKLSAPFLKGLQAFLRHRRSNLGESRLEVAEHDGPDLINRHRRDPSNVDIPQRRHRSVLAQVRQVRRAIPLRELRNLVQLGGRYFVRVLRE